MTANDWYSCNKLSRGGLGSGHVERELGSVHVPEGSGTGHERGRSGSREG